MSTLVRSNRISQHIVIPRGSNKIDHENGGLRTIDALAVLDAMPFNHVGGNYAISDDDQLITRINVPPASRGKGYGRLLLTQACAVADLTRTPLWIHADAYGNGIGLTQTQLETWYHRNGFIDTDHGYMLRLPR